jgi:hypothetical protein
MSSNTQEGLKNTLQDSHITLGAAQSDLEDSDIDVFEGVGNPESTNTATVLTGAGRGLICDTTFAPKAIAPIISVVVAVVSTTTPASFAHF